MAKFDPYSLSSKERGRILDEFYSLVTSLRKKEQVIDFFKDLLTPSEAVMLARRIQVAKMLLRGDDYEEIKRKLRVGAGTITSVQRWLKDGFVNYIKALEKIIKTEEVKEEIDMMRNSSLNSIENLAYRYPLYFSSIHELYKMFKGHNKEKRGRKRKKK